MVCVRMPEVCGKKEVANPPSFPPSFFNVEKMQMFSHCYSSLISRRVFPQGSRTTNIQYLYSIEKLRLVMGKMERRAGMNTGLERVWRIRSWSWEEEEKEVPDGLRGIFCSDTQPSVIVLFKEVHFRAVRFTM